MTQIKDLSNEQLLMYVGAAATAGCGLSTLGDKPVIENKIYSKAVPTVPGGVGRRLMHWHGFHSVAFTALQALAAHEKPSHNMVGVTGACWMGAAALTATHTLHHKSIKRETGIALSVAQAALGGALVAQAIQMKNKKVV